MAKQIDNTAANIKLLKNQTKQLREQIVVLEKLKKLEDGITEAQESQLENYVKQLKAKRSELKASKKHVNSSKDWNEAQSAASKIYKSLNTDARKLLETEYHYSDLTKVLVNNAKQSNTQEEIKFDLAMDTLKMTGKLADMESKMGTDRFSDVDTSQLLNKLADERMRIQEDFSDDLKGHNKKQLLAEVDMMEKLILAGKKRADMNKLVVQHTEAYNAKIKEVQDKWNNVKAKITSIVTNPMKALLVGVLAIGAGLVSMAKKMFDFGNETGFSYTQLIKFGPAIMFAGEEMKALLGEFGSLDIVTGKNLMQMKMLTFQYGVSAESAAKLTEQMMAISGSTFEAATNSLMMVGQLARANGVAPAAVMEDLAGDMEFFASYAKDGGDNLFTAAIEARKLGLSIATTSKMAEGLLDFESSIEAQMEASILLGRNINTDMARRLALSGDMAGMQREILKQVGSQADFERMNVIQRKKLAAAFGIGVEELSKMILNQEHINHMTTEEQVGLGVIQKLLKFVSDLWTTIKDKVAGAFSEIDVGKESMDKLSNVAKLVATDIAGWVTSLIEWVGGLGAAGDKSLTLIERIDNLKAGFKSISEVFEKIVYWGKIAVITAGFLATAMFIVAAATGTFATALALTGLPAIIAAVVFLGYILYKTLWPILKIVGKGLIFMFSPIVEMVKFLIDGAQAIGSWLFGGETSIEPTVPALAEGGTVLQTGVAKVHKGEFIGQPNQLQQNVGSQTDMTETNALLKKLVEYNKKLIDDNVTLMGKLTNKVGDLGVT